MERKRYILCHSYRCWDLGILAFLLPLIGPYWPLGNDFSKPPGFHLLGSLGHGINILLASLYFCRARATYFCANFSPYKYTQLASPQYQQRYSPRTLPWATYSVLCSYLIHLF